MPATITDRNRMPEIIAELRRLKGLEARIGVFDMEELVRRAAANEFGLGHNPERSVFRASMHDNAGLIADHSQAGVRRVMKGTASARDVHESVGLLVDGLVKDKMNDQIPPPLAPETVARKGSDKTWIDSGETRNAVTHMVADRKG